MASNKVKDKNGNRIKGREIKDLSLRDIFTSTGGAKNGLGKCI